MKYTNPETQKLSDDLHACVTAAQEIIDSMRATVNQQRRKTDSPVEITAEQAAKIQANQGVHIYGPSHPKYTG